MSTRESAQKSLDMARQCIVLLQNKNNVLPLKAGKERIAVIGPNADNQPMMWGNYNGTPNHTITILDGICGKLGVKKEKIVNSKSVNRKLLYLPGCDLTYDQVMDCRLASECRADGRAGMRGTFWNNMKMEGKPVCTQQYTTPLAVTTAGMHNFAPGVALSDFSAKYETTFTPRQAGEYVVNVQGTGHYEVFIDGERKQRVHSWRSTPTRTVLEAEAGKSYQIEVRYAFVPTWGADLKIDVAKELPIDYQAIIRQLEGIHTVVFAGGISPALEGEEMPVHIDGFKGGDRTSIELPRVQRDFLKALKAAGKTVIFVNCSGSAIALQPETETCDAIVQAWYAGQEGGTAVADVLYGDVCPSGKLPITFYRSTDQLPDYEDYSMKGRTYRYFSDPLFAFGYGLSYTSFHVESSECKIKSKDNESLVSEKNTLHLALSTLNATLQVPIKNTGLRDGTEVVQLYVRDLSDTEGPLRSLRGFQRIDVKAGQTAVAELPLTPKTFELWNPATNTMQAHAGRYEVLYGTSSRTEDLHQFIVELN